MFFSSFSARKNVKKQNYAILYRKSIGVFKVIMKIDRVVFIFYENISYAEIVFFLEMLTVKELELKSVKTERAVIGLITKFLDIIDQEDLQDGKYDWLDPELAVKPVTSSSKLIVGPDAGEN